MIELLHAVASDDAEALVIDRFWRVAEPEATFAGKVGAILDEVVRLSRHDRWRDALLRLRRDVFLQTLVDAAIDAGEIASDDREIVIGALVATIAGLVGVGSVAPAAQAEAVQGFKRLFRCDFLNETKPRAGL